MRKKPVDHLRCIRCGGLVRAPIHEGDHPERAHAFISAKTLADVVVRAEAILKSGEGGETSARTRWKTTLSTMAKQVRSLRTEIIQQLGNDLATPEALDDMETSFEVAIEQLDEIGIDMHSAAILRIAARFAKTEAEATRLIELSRTERDSETDDDELPEECCGAAAGLVGPIGATRILRCVFPIGHVGVCDTVARS